MKKKLTILFFLFSSSLHANEDLTGKFLLCPKLLWGFEFISFNKVNVVDTDINNVTQVNQYYYETDSKLPYINLYIVENNIKNLVYSIHNKTLRVDIWTMTSGGITTREIIPRDFCKNVKIDNILDYIEGLKNIN